MSDFDNSIVQIIEDVWQKSEKITHLTYLGSILRKLYDLNLHLQGIKLMPYIQFKLSDKIDLVQNPKDKLTWGAVPKGKADQRSQEEIAGLFVRDKAVTANIATDSINFHRTVWAAFSKPVAKDYVRALKLAEPKNFVDYNRETDVPSEFLPIMPFASYLIGAPDAIKDVATVKRAISEWSKEHGIAIEDLAFEKSSFNRRSPLRVLIEALDEDELKSVQLPLSAIKKLL